MSATLLRNPAPPLGTLAETHLRRLAIVQQAEAILVQGPPAAAALRLQTTCRRLGISPRALHTAFVTVHGVSPGRYLRDRRLALVREVLRAAPERRSAVKRAALAIGFRHLGHFSRAYRDLFGELPSETIARALCDGGAAGPSPAPSPPAATLAPPAAAARQTPPAP